jgi:glycosyltransferase involved in cell wall biosynthesis
MSQTSRPPKVLHVVGMMDRWSVETWLLHMLAHARRRGDPVDWSFYCAFGVEGSKDEEARALGAPVIQTPVPIAQKAAFVSALREELKRGQYDVIHAHHDLVSGLYLLSALGLPIRKRLVHVHNPDEDVLTPSRLIQAVFKPVLRRTCLALADQIVANSGHSLDVFLAGRRRRPGRDIIHYLGIDPAPFEAPPPDRKAFRKSLGLAEDTPILLFAGRVTPEKNPVFTVDVLAALRQRLPNAVAVFAGAGSLEDAVRERARTLGQEDAVHCLGWRNDVAAVMGVCDWFILPHPEHPREGFGIAVVEAQLGGLRMLLSKGVGDDPLLPTAAYRRLSLSDSPALWAQAAMELWEGPAPSRKDALAAFKASPMDMDFALTDLLGLYA